MPLHNPTGYFGAAPVNHTGRQCSLPAQDTLPGRYIRAAFRHVVFEPLDFLARLAALALRGPTEAAGKPDTIPWRLCCQQPVSVRSNARAKRQTIGSTGKITGREAQSDELHPQGIKAQRLKRVFNIDPNAARLKSAPTVVAR